MNLFEIKNDQVTFAPQALALKPFHTLWQRDTTKDKAVAIAELAAVYYYTDYRSDFRNMLEDDTKLAVIKSVIIGIPDNWEPDREFIKACQFYDQMQETPSTLLLKDAEFATASVRKFLKNLNMEETDEKGKPIHDVKKIIDSLGNLHKVTESLFELQEQVKKQIQQKNDSVRGNRQKAVFEDGID